MEGRACTPLILIVEDDPDLCNLITTVLELDLEVRTAGAEDGEQALDLVRTLRPDLVLLDAELEKPCGLEIARRLKSDPQTMAVPLVGISAEPRRPVLAAGFNDHVSKPFDLFEFVRTVKAYLHPSLQLEAAT